MDTTSIAIVIGGTVALCAMFLMFSLSRLKSEVPSEDREYMDPLPTPLKIVWPIVRFLEFHLCAFIPPNMLERTHEKLQLTGVGYLLNAEQFYAVRIVSVLAVFGVTAFTLDILNKDQPWILYGSLLLGYFYPEIWLHDVRGRRYKAVQKALPVYLDFITMAVEAGLNLTGAINQAMEKGPTGPLRHEFFMVVRDLRSGLMRCAAWKSDWR